MSVITYRCIDCGKDITEVACGCRCPECYKRRRTAAMKRNNSKGR